MYRILPIADVGYGNFLEVGSCKAELKLHDNFLGNSCAHLTGCIFFIELGTLSIILPSTSEGHPKLCFDVVTVQFCSELLVFALL
jgi:hypothetical protein